MALSLSKLEDNLETWLDGLNSYATALASATEFFTQYKDYAADALDFTGDAVVGASFAESAARSQLAGAIPPGTASAAAGSAFESAVQLFWASATFATTIPPAGWLAETDASVTTPPQAISAGMAAVFAVADPGDTNRDKAEALAAVLHGAVGSIVVTVNGNDGGGSPASTTGGVS